MDIYIAPTHRLKARVTRIALQCSQENMDIEMCVNNFIFTEQFHDIVSLSLSLCLSLSLSVCLSLSLSLHTPPTHTQTQTHTRAHTTRKQWVFILKQCQSRIVFGSFLPRGYRLWKWLAVISVFDVFVCFLISWLRFLVRFVFHVLCHHHFFTVFLLLYIICLTPLLKAIYVMSPLLKAI